MKRKSLAFVGLLGTSGIQCLSGRETSRSFIPSGNANHITNHDIAGLIDSLNQGLQHARFINRNQLGKKKARMLRKAEFHAEKANSLLKKIHTI